ncbi:hypothetical protein ADK41_00255 [Streptomyces caelestis]|uniref:Uncharacterized protein n=1 Tax=Streptomyces caelestis TaxID=36816 RepID=A0A0M8QP20_9ACTN|nr:MULTISPECIES: hypothetical protein [Streptomyces]KOT46699.1 hypothetical protein ADK41_00255 [Streptomyces caelestis]
MSFNLRALANGLHTDHPIPGLPFVDDSHIPVDDGEAVEAVGRNVGQGMWGRFDPERIAGGWRAFTTDPDRHGLSWAVRYHPTHGKTVLLVPSGHAADLHTEWHGGPLLFRAGGYWWDGTDWYRPGQIWDPVAEEFERRKAAGAVTVTAADLLAANTTFPDRATVVQVADFDKDAPAPENWLDHLALWAQLTTGDGHAFALEHCVVNVSSPELAGDQLIGVPDMATLGGIGASTLRAYISRNESSVPPPQAVVAGRAMWSRPVGQDWAESRRRSAEGVRAAMSASGEEGSLSVGAEAVRQRFTEDFFRALWENPGRRKQWVLRHRNEADVRDVADDLASTVALSLDRILPADLLRTTVRHAILDDLGQDLADRDGAEVKEYEIRLTPQVAKMLDWLIRHHPDTAKYTIGDTLRQIESRWEVPPRVAGEGLRASLEMDGELDEALLAEYLDRVLPTEASGS